MLIRGCTTALIVLASAAMGGGSVSLPFRTEGDSRMDGRSAGTTKTGNVTMVTPITVCHTCEAGRQRVE
jgi:hypothetical protein